MEQMGMCAICRRWEGWSNGPWEHTVSFYVHLSVCHRLLEKELFFFFNIPQSSQYLKEVCNLGEWGGGRGPLKWKNRIIKVTFIRPGS